MSSFSYTGNQAPPPTAHSYSFPKLSTGEIQKCLAELSLSVSKEELQQPEQYRDNIRRLLEQLSEICLGIRREELAQPAFVGLNAINYPELHEESIPHINSLRAIMRMMEICEVTDFSIRDIISPSASRLNRQLSGIVNFCKFREERLQLLNNLTNAREELLNELAELTDNNETLVNRLNLLRSQTADEGDIIQRLETESRQLETTVLELQAQEAQAGQESQHLSEQNAQAEERIAQAQAQLKELTDTQRRLEGQIVTSPEKFRTQIIEVGQTLAHEQRDAKVAEKKVRELTAWLANIEDAQAEVNLALEALHEVRGEVERQKSFIAELDSHKQGNNQLKTIISELEQNTQQQQRQITRADDKLAQYRKQAHERAAESQRMIDELHSQLVASEGQRLHMQSQTERMESEVVRMEAELSAEATTQEEELNEIRSTYHRLEQKVISHLRELQRVLVENDLNTTSSSFPPPPPSMGANGTRRFV